MKAVKVLITNGDNLRALSFLRAVCDKKDIELHIAAERNFNACFFSRYCKHKFINVNPKKDPDKFLKQIQTYARIHKIDVIIPMNADELDLILKNRMLFKNTEIPFVNYNLFSKVKDKWEFYKIMKSLKISTPKTIQITDEKQLKKISLNFPVIIKIRRGAGSKGVKKANNQEELEKAFKEIIKEHNLTKESYPLIQEYLEGEYYCAAAICKNGKTESVMTYKSLRQYPIDHGTSTSRISVQDKIIETEVRKILTYLKWHGIAQFDIIKKEDKYFFLEMNPRFYTSISVTVKSGLNYPYTLCNMEKHTLPKDYKAGVKTRIIMPDKQVFLESIFKKNRYPLKEYFNLKNTSFDDLDLKDPLPTIPLIVKFIRGKLL